VECGRKTRRRSPENLITHHPSLITQGSKKMTNSWLFMGVSFITGLLSFIAALVLFLRVRSTATGLFLGGTAISPLVPFMTYLLGHNMMAFMGLIALAHVCAAVGLLMYAISLPKATAVPVAAVVSNENPLLK
jgi:hypothetical protein